MSPVRIRTTSRYERDLRSAIEREQSRAERFHSPTCIVEFDASRLEHPQRVVRILLKGLSRRVRAVDKFGRITESTIGLLLPATEPTGAGRVVGDVFGNMRPGERPFYTVRRYPAIRTTVTRIGGAAS